MAIYQHATLDRDKALAEKIGETYTNRTTRGRSERSCRCYPADCWHSVPEFAFTQES
jgi:hypothetical protein